MRIKAVSSLVGGEVLAEPILTEKNDILIPNGTRIKPDYVPLIESLGIESVMVEDPYEIMKARFYSRPGYFRQIRGKSAQTDGKSYIS